VLETHHSRKQLDSLEAELGGCQAEIGRLNESEEASRAGIDKGESQLAEQRHALDEIDAQIADVRGELQRVQSEIGTHQNRIQFNRQRAEEFTELIERFRNGIAAAEAKHTRQQEEIQSANALIEATRQLLEEKEAELAKRINFISELSAARSDFKDRETNRRTARRNFRALNSSPNHGGKSAKSRHCDFRGPRSRRESRDGNLYRASGW